MPFWPLYTVCPRWVAGAAGTGFATEAKEDFASDGGAIAFLKNKHKGVFGYEDRLRKRNQEQ